MTHKQRIVVEARLQGKTAKECAKISGLSQSYCKHLITGEKGGVKDELIKRTAEIEQKMRMKTDITRDDIIAKFIAIHDLGVKPIPVRNTKGRIISRRFNLTAANKALENIARMLGYYDEDNKQRRPESLGKALANLIKARAENSDKARLKRIESTAKDAEQASPAVFESGHETPKTGLSGSAKGGGGEGKSETVVSTKGAP